MVDKVGCYGDGEFTSELLAGEPLQCVPLTIRSCKFMLLCRTGIGVYIDTVL